MMCQTNLLSDYGCLYLLLPKAKPKLLCFYFFLDSNQNSRISASSRISRVPFRTREQQFTLIPSGSIVNNRKKWRIRNRSDFHWKEAARISCQEFSFSGRVKGYTTMDRSESFRRPGEQDKRPAYVYVSRTKVSSRFLGKRAYRSDAGCLGVDITAVKPITGPR